MVRCCGPGFLEVVLDLCRLVLVNGVVATRKDIVGSTLEDGEFLYVRGDFGDNLHAGSASADEGDTFASQIYVLLRPFRCLVVLAFESLEASEGQFTADRQGPGGGNKVPAGGCDAI